MNRSKQSTFIVSDTFILTIKENVFHYLHIFDEQNSDSVLSMIIPFVKYDLLFLEIIARLFFCKVLSPFNHSHSMSEVTEI